MKNYSKKLLFVPLLALALIALPLFSASASSSDFKPRLEMPLSISSHSVLLRFNAKDSTKNRTVVVKMSIKNMKTGMTMLETATTKVNGDKIGTVIARNLMSGTPYDIKIKVRKITLSDYSHFSNTRRITTASAPAASTSTSNSSSTSDSSTDNTNSSQ